MIGRIGMWLAGMVLLGALAQEEPEPSFQTTAEIERRGKKIVVVKTGPDEPPAIIALRDLAGGPLEAIDAEKGVLKVGGKDYTTDKLTTFSREGKAIPLAELKVGEQVRLEVAEQNDGTLRAFDVRAGAGAKAEGKSLSRSLFADPPPFRVQISFGDDAKAFGPIARVEQVQGFNDFVFMTGGTAKYIEAEDRLELNLDPKPRAVEVQQGRSKAFGSRLDYDNESGDARVAGPIELERSGDKPLKGAARDMVYNVDDELLRLTGGVQLEQDGRKTAAQSALVREKDRVAYLYGTKDKPVRSDNKDGFVEGTVVLYNLETSDVTVLEGVRGEFKDP